MKLIYNNRGGCDEYDVMFSLIMVDIIIAQHSFRLDNDIIIFLGLDQPNRQNVMILKWNSMHFYDQQPNCKYELWW